MLTAMRTAFFLFAALAASSAASAAAPAADEGRARALAAETALLEGRHAEAEKEAQAALDAGFETPALRQLRAELRLRAGKPAEALAEADRALALNAESAAGRRWRGRALLALGRADEGLDDLRRASVMDRSLAAEYEAERAKQAPAEPFGRRYRKIFLLLAGLPAVLAWSAYKRGRRSAHLVRFGALAREAAAPDEPRAGAVVGGRFVVGKRLERGAWGQRFEGRDLEDRPVVITRYAPGSGRRFDLERAKKASALAHPGLRAPLAVFEDGAWGTAVSSASPAPTLGKGLEPAAVLSGAAPVCEALDAAHAAGLLHGAVAPRLLRVEQPGWRLEGLGLPEPPEAATKPPEGQESEAGDLYALACCVREALGGAAVVGLDAFFVRALAAEPERRFRSGAEMLVALRSVLSPSVH
jgi:hypothetical protein